MWLFSPSSARFYKELPWVLVGVEAGREVSLAVRIQNTSEEHTSTSAWILNLLTEKYKWVAPSRIGHTLVHERRETVSRRPMENNNQLEDIRTRAFLLCKEYLHGAWNSINENELQIKQIRWELKGLQFRDLLFVHFQNTLRKLCWLRCILSTISNRLYYAKAATTSVTFLSIMYGLNILQLSLLRCNIV